MDLTAHDDWINHPDRQAGVEITDAMVEAACDVLDESGLLEWGMRPCPLVIGDMIRAALQVANFREKS